MQLEPTCAVSVQSTKFSFEFFAILESFFCATDLGQTHTPETQRDGDVGPDARRSVIETVEYLAVRGNFSLVITLFSQAGSFADQSNGHRPPEFSIITVGETLDDLVIHRNRTRKIAAPRECISFF